MRCYSVLTLVVLVIAALPSPGRSAGLTVPGPSVKARLGSHFVRVLENARSVDVYQVQGYRKNLGPLLFAGYSVVGRGKTQGRAFARELSHELLDPQAYDRVPSACIMEPVVGYRIHSSVGSIDVLVCFHCGQLALTTDPPDPSPRGWVFGNFLNRSALLATARRALPDDRDLQALKDQNQRGIRPASHHA